MSHFTRVRTQYKDADLLVRALEDLGYKGKVERHKQAVPLIGWGGAPNQRKVYGEVVIRKNDLRPPHSDLGFERKADGKLAMWADSDFLAQNPDFAASIAQRYAYHATVTTLDEQGFVMAEEVVESTGEIRLVMRRTV